MFVLTRIKGKMFQSTLLVRGATVGRVEYTWQPSVSIHAPRERSDRGSPLGSRRMEEFQSTLLVRGAT